MERQDIVVIGASAGGIEALSELVSRLDPKMKASIFIVVHLPATATSVLPQILSRRGPIKAIHPVDGQRIERGMIYVAPPDCHLMLGKKGIRLVRGPREHGVRPAVDPLFRSAALAFGERVVGVVLSGNLDDGTAGLEAIKNGGGRTIVQDPSEALYTGMIDSALRNGVAGETLPVALIAAELNDVIEAPEGGEEMPGKKEKVREEEKEVAIDSLEFGQLHGDDQPGIVSGFTCPECNGALWELTASESLRFRCRVGHAYAVDSLLDQQKVSIENAFWIALRALEERGALLRRLVVRAEKSGTKTNVRRYAEEQQAVASRAKALRDVILSGILGGGADSIAS
ncbi:MAG TPA: chemotaxis protein CheB [Gemmatimonadaceae bacterium]|jgi:two-component system, chemotaxis family, protein-glutamate methylesterase/glutaminase|nr:chemotaxis protein CheB [Gemmatimonadaceae bacterium]